MRRWILLPVLALVLVGCGLSPEQQKAYDTAMVAKEKAVEKVNVLETRLVEYKADAEAIFKKIKDKEIPWAEAAPLIAKLSTNFEADKAALVEAKDSMKALATDIKKLNDLKVPWYYYIGPLVTGLLGIFGGYLPGARKAGAATSVANTVIAGVEKGNDPGTKGAIRDEATMAGVEALLHAMVRKRGG